MSKYLEMRTTLTDERYLVEALRELGYEPEVCREGVHLTGYMGDERAERAQVIIPRLWVGRPTSPRHRPRFRMSELHAS